MNPLLAKAEALKHLVLGVLLVACIVASYQFGRHVKTGEVAEEQRKAEQAIAVLKQDRQDVADLLNAANATRRAENAPKEKIITREVLRYVDVTPATQRCTLPGTWRVRHDAAASGVPITAETGPLAFGTDAPVEDAAALGTVADNYAIARECAAKLEGWQRRYVELERKVSR